MNLNGWIGPDGSRTGGRRNTRWLWIALLLIGGALILGMDPATGADPATGFGSAIPQPTAPLAVAQAGAVSLSLDVQTGRLPTLIELFNTSLVINSIIASLSVLAVLLFIYFMLTIHTGSMAPAGFVDEVTKLVLNRRYDQATDLCRRHNTIFAASILQRCVENAGKAHSVIMDMLNTEGRRRADIVWNRISYLADVSNVAPMLGLLGTVLGMIKAFFLLPTQSGNINSKVLSQGIGQAMATTMFGLIVAITALVFYSIAKARVTRTLAEVEQVVHSVADHIKRGDA